MAQTLSAPSPRGASDAERTAVVGKAVVRAAEALGLTGAELARTLGLSDASVSRLKAGTFALEPSSKAYEIGAAPHPTVPGPRCDDWGRGAQCAWLDDFGQSGFC